MNRLFVYGTLGPGKPNEHVLADLGGSWEPAVVRGSLRPEGWGAEMGCPGLKLEESGEDIDGLLFRSEHLASRWAQLDEFEGEAYERVVAQVRLRDGSMEDAFVYALR